MNKKLYSIITFGCQMNIHESEKLAGMMESLGYRETKEEDKADVIIFNTCCIRESAENKARGNIGALKPLKQRKKDLIIAVGGCMTQQAGEAEKLIEKFPFVDIVFGTQNLHLFKKFLEEKLKLKKKIVQIENNAPLPPEDTLFFRTSGENAWINITYGCNNFCTYCIVPYVRGRERSRKQEDIIAEIKEVLNTKKYKTITLLGQNVNSYGKDLDKKTNFSQLLLEICKINGNFTVTFLTSHPKDFSDELIETIAQNEKISRHIHLPVQSGSTKILKAMNRGYSREHYISLINRIRTKIPNADITTDIIVGFPGETEEDFQDTISLIKEVKFNQLFAYMFSKRRGTLAEKMEGQILLSEKRRRVNLVLNTQKEIMK